MVWNWRVYDAVNRFIDHPPSHPGLASDPVSGAVVPGAVEGGLWANGGVFLDPAPPDALPLSRVGARRRCGVRRRQDPHLR